MVVTKKKEMPYQRVLSSWSIRNKLLLLFFCIFLPALILAFVNGMNERREIIARAEQGITTVAESMAAQHEQMLTSTRQLLVTLSQLPDVQQRNVKACNTLFLKLIQEYPHYTNISLATPDGNMIAASMPFIPGSVNLSDRRHIREAIRTLDFSAGEYVVGRISKVPSLNFTYPVLDRHGKLRAIVIAAFNLNEYEQYITRIQMPVGAAVSITDYKGVRLFRWPSNATAAVGKPIPMTTIDRAMRALRGIFRQEGSDGVNRIYALRAMNLRKGAPPYLYMMVGINEQGVLHEANARMMTQIMIVGCIGLLVAVLTWLFVLLIVVRPIRKLSLASQKLGRGQRDVRTGLPHSADEIGKLANAFDSMATLLDAREKERDEAEQALRESELRFRRISAITSDIAYSCRTEEDGIFRLIG